MDRYQCQLMAIDNWLVKNDFSDTPNQIIVTDWDYEHTDGEKTSAYVYFDIDYENIDLKSEYSEISLNQSYELKYLNDDCDIGITLM